MADDAKPSTRAVLKKNTERRAKRPALERVEDRFPHLNIADYAAMSPLAIGESPIKRGKKPRP